MKNLAIMLALVAFSFLAKAQTIGDRSSGKYYANPKISDITGNWISNEGGKEIQFEITTKKAHYKSVNLDYYGDAIYIKIIKYVKNGEDFAKKLTEPLMLTGTSSRFGGIRQDQITKNEISIQLDSKDENNLLMRAHTLYDVKTGTFFHRNIKLTRKK